MRKFVYGTARQFDNLYGRLASDERKKIWFTIEFPNSTHARLGFRCLRGRIVVEMVRYGEEGFPEYSGDNVLLSRLVSERTIVFDNMEQMRSSFDSIKEIYEGGNDRKSIPAAIVRTVPERIEHIPTVIDPALLSEEIKENIVGQDSQIDGLVQCVCNHLRKKLPQKPLVVMLPGPTGVGKTATVRKLAECLKEKLGEAEFPLISVSCNEFQEPYRISQLTGSPQGYVGHDEPCLMSVVARTGRFILLLDEYEKLDPTISMAIMQWMEGKITLSRIKDGEENAEYDCRGSIFILTSNIDMGQGEVKSIRFSIPEPDNSKQPPILPQSSDDSCRQTMIKNGFRPEIASRISFFFQFKPLAKVDIENIAIIAFKKKLAEYGFLVDAMGQSLINDIRARYTSSKFGARPLENALDEVLGRQLPPPSDRDQHIKVDGTVENLIITEVKYA